MLSDEQIREILMDKWISVNDRLPEETTPVEFKGKGHFYRARSAAEPFLERFVGPGAWERDDGLANAITHWRPVREVK